MINDFSGSVIKFRVNQQLIEYKSINHDQSKKLILLIKYKSNMNLNHSKTPQSSAFNLLINDELIRLRVSTLMTQYQESIVMRLNNQQYKRNTSDLLLIKEQENLFKEALQYKTGLILITGPTSSGKTTLTYTLLNQFKKMGLSIVTIEDPVEQYDDGIVQLQINENSGVNYEIGVKEILRHDPDIIFIGEIRDAKSAKSALRASLTGHLVLTTMHAPNALKALYRLLELGLTLFECEQTLVLITNQRLAYHDSNQYIILEHLTYPCLPQVYRSIKEQTTYQYKTIENYLNDYKEYQVIK